MSTTSQALVVTPGQFTLPPTKAYAQGQPELLGLSAGGKWGSQDPAWAGVVVGRTKGVSRTRARVCVPREHAMIMTLVASIRVRAGVRN